MRPDSTRRSDRGTGTGRRRTGMLRGECEAVIGASAAASSVFPGDFRGSEQTRGSNDAVRMCGVRARRDALARVQLRAMAVEFPEVHGHPNRLPFEGVLTLVDVASDKAPSGSRGHRVVLTKEAAEAALPSLLGMAVGYKTGWDGHDARQKCGIITGAELDGRRLMVTGFLFARDFPEFEDGSKPGAAKRPGSYPFEDGAMGMSYELADAHVADMRASVWTLTRATFTGAAILLREKAAYRSTSFRIKRAGCRSSRKVATAAH